MTTITTSTNYTHNVKYKPINHLKTENEHQFTGRSPKKPISFWILHKDRHKNISYIQKNKPLEAYTVRAALNRQCKRPPKDSFPATGLRMEM